MLFEHITIVTIITGIDITDITVIDIITGTIERNFLVKRAAVAYRSRRPFMFPADHSDANESIGVGSRHQAGIKKCSPK
jgi:hypothetical protein